MNKKSKLNIDSVFYYVFLMVVVSMLAWWHDLAALIIAIFVGALLEVVIK